MQGGQDKYVDPYHKSHAVVIGINDYRNGILRLANACNDAKSFAELLRKKFAFDNVITLLDSQASQKAILNALRDQLPSLARLNDRVVIFFSGHGATRKTTDTGSTSGYIIPQDAGVNGYADYINMEEFRQACGHIPAKHILIILDCCFSGVAAISDLQRGSSLSSSKDDSRYLQRITTKKAWQIITAGASDETVSDGNILSGHSPFVTALLSGLDGSADQDENGIITAFELSVYIKRRVINETYSGDKGQMPFFSYIRGCYEGGDFAFILPDYGEHIQQSAGITSYEAVMPSTPYTEIELFKWGNWKSQESFQKGPWRDREWFQRGEELLKEGRYDAAIKCFKNVTHAANNNQPEPHAMYKIGICLSKLGKYNEANVAFEEAKRTAIRTKAEDWHLD